MAKIWRGWKSRLTNDYILKPESGKYGKDPCQSYTYMAPDVWQAYVQSRSTEEWKELSAAQRDRRNKNVHNHRLGPGGYAKQRKSFATEEMKRRVESGGSTTDDPIPARPRHMEWIEARKDKKTGRIPNPDTQTAAEQMNEIYERRSQGTYVFPTIQDDEVTVALGTPEHPGRVRAMGFGVGLKDFYNSNFRGRGHVLKETLSQQGTSSTMHSSTTEVHPPPTSQPQPGPSHEHGGPPEDLQGVKCKLLLGDPKQIVAEAIIHHSPGAMLHNIPLGDDVYKVNVVRILEGMEDMDLPFPNPAGDQFLLRDAEDSFVAWPRDLVMCGRMPTAKSTRPKPTAMHTFKDLVDATILEGLPENAKILHNMLKRLPSNKIMTVPMPESIACIERTVEVAVLDCIELFLYEWLNTSILEVWICNIYETSSEFCFKVGFLIPTLLTLPDDELCEYITNSLRQFKGEGKDIIMAPYNIDNSHWILVVIRPDASAVDILDPQNKKPKLIRLRAALKASIQVYNADIYKTDNVVKFSYVKCPKQKDNWECGYYVMEYMKMILSYVIPVEPYAYSDSFSTDPLTPAKLNKLRDEWCEYFIVSSSV